MKPCARLLRPRPNRTSSWQARSPACTARSMTATLGSASLPAKHDDLRNFDSVAFDPRDENIIYAGTYHLPWKTTDGGKNWFPISKGMIDDSDVMSVVVDPANPDNVHAHGVLRHLPQHERRAAVDALQRHSFRLPPHAADPAGSPASGNAVCRHDQRPVEDHQRRHRMEAPDTWRLGDQRDHHRSEESATRDSGHRARRRADQRKRRPDLYRRERWLPPPAHSGRGDGSASVRNARWLC